MQSFGQEGNGLRNVVNRRHIELVLLSLQEKIIHGINTPLATISSCTEGLLSRLRDKRIDTDLFRRYLSIIDEEVWRCRNTTLNIPSFIRCDNSSKTINIDEIFRLVLDMLSVQGRLQKISVTQKLSGCRFGIYGEEDIVQMVAAVINNSIDSMPDGGELVISMICKDKCLLLSVCDNGRKIPDEHISAFNSSNTAEACEDRACYNLLIARDIVRDYGGKMNISYDFGTGNIVEITMPYKSFFSEGERAAEMEYARY